MSSPYKIKQPLIEEIKRILVSLEYEIIDDVLFDAVKTSVLNHLSHRGIDTSTAAVVVTADEEMKKQKRFDVFINEKAYNEAVGISIDKEFYISVDKLFVF